MCGGCRRRRERTAFRVIHSAYIVDAAAESLRPFHPVMADGTSAFSDKGSPLTAICPEVGPAGDETVLIKTEASAFGKGAARPQARRAPASNGCSSPACGPRPASTPA